MISVERHKLEVCTCPSHASRRSRSGLEATRLPLPTGHLKLPGAIPVHPLVAHTLLGVTSRHTTSLAEVPLSLPALVGGTQQHDALAQWGSECELVKGDALATVLDDACAGSLSEPKSAHAELWDLSQALVVCDGGNDHCGL